MLPLVQDQRAETLLGGSESESWARFERFALRVGVTSSYRRSRNQGLIIGFGF